MNFRVEYVRPDVLQRSGRCLRRVATERATKPREVDLSRLKGFHLRFAPKMRRDLQLVRWHLEVECSIKTIECVCVSPGSKEQIKFVYSVLKWLRTKILNENWRYRVAKKDQSLFESWIDHRKGDIYPVAKDILCRNCAGKNETVVRKILEVRESFESSRIHWSQERRDKVHEKYMYWRTETRNNKRALFVTYNDFRWRRSILNCFSVDEKCGDGCWESRADFQVSVNFKIY